MGIGAMMAGGNPSEGRQERDWYPTPPEATIALLKAESFEGVIHECACGDGAIGRIFENRGYKVVASDLHPLGYGIRHNFFTIKKPVGHNIVTNPPFDLARQFIEHGLSLQPRKMALLLKSTYFHAANRLEMFERNPPAVVYPLTWRLDFLNKGRPTMECAWFVWRRGNNAHPVYQPLAKPTPNDIREYSTMLQLAA